MEIKVQCDCGQKFKFDVEPVTGQKLEGEAWATGLGFKPGEEGFKGFTMEDANALTEQLGLKLSGRPDPASCIVVRSGAKP